MRRRGIEVVALAMKGRPRGAAAADDVIAAAQWLVAEGKCDPHRIAAIGACDGAAAAIEAGRREGGGIAAVACLSPPAPGTDGLAAAADLRWPGGKPLLFLAHREDADAAQHLAETAPAARLLVYDDEHTDAVMPDGERGWFRGTWMFDRVSMVEQTLASFVAAGTGSTKDDVVLDGFIADETAPGGAWTRAGHMRPSDDLEGWVYLADGRLTFAIRADPSVRFVEFGWAHRAGSAKVDDRRRRWVSDPDWCVRIDPSTGTSTENRTSGMPSPGGRAPGADTPMRLVVRSEGGRVVIEGEILVSRRGVPGPAVAAFEIRKRDAARTADDDFSEEWSRIREIRRAVDAAIAEQHADDRADLIQRVRIRQEVEDRMTPGRVRIVER